MVKPRYGRLLAAASLISLAAIAVRADEQPGDLWETTSQTVMEGMPMAMPMQKLTLCTAKEWKQPPAASDRSCKQTNYQRVGNKATWAIECSGDVAMSGTGEMTFDGDSYTGEIKLTAEGMNMLVKLTGKKIGGCDNPTQ